MSGLDWLKSSLQTGFAAAQKQAQEAAEKAKVLAVQAQAQAKIYAEQAEKKAKARSASNSCTICKLTPPWVFMQELASAAADEAQARFQQLAAATAATVSCLRECGQGGGRNGRGRRRSSAVLCGPAAALPHPLTCSIIAATLSPYLIWVCRGAADTLARGSPVHAAVHPCGTLRTLTPLTLTLAVLVPGRHWRGIRLGLGDRRGPGRAA